MKFRIVYLILFLSLQCCILVVCNSYYSIIAPGSLKSNRKYAVAVTLHDAPEPAAMKITITGPDIDESQEIFVKPHETKLIEYQIPQLMGDTPYKLIAEGLSGLIFKNETDLDAIPDKGPYIYVQTDRKIYKPKDLVKFRVVIVDEHTKPLEITEPIRVEIIDAAGNRVKQFKDIKLIMGVFTGEIQLSEHPLLGVWQIKTLITGQYSYSRSSTFDVRKYVLPKFNVILECPEHLILEDGDGILKVQLHAKYTYGKYVEGHATIALQDGVYYNFIEQKKLDVQTISTVTFDLNNPNLNIVANNGLVINANFTENLTGNIQNGACFISLHNHPYQIIADYESIKFNNSKPYQLQAKLRYWNDTAVIDPETPMYMKHGTRLYEAYINDNGIATFQFEHNATANHIFTYRKVTAEMYNIYIPKPEEKISLLKLRLLEDKPQLGKTIEVEVSSTQSIPYLVYTLVGHGDIIRTDHIIMPANQKTYLLKIEPSIEMVPQFYLYVYFIQNGNWTYEELRIQLRQELENKVSVTALKQVKPGTEVTLEINAHPNSYVCLLAVDLSVYFLDKTYDLYEEDIINDLRLDVTWISIPNVVTYPGMLSGLMTLTNAHFPFEVLNYGGGYGGSGFGGGDIQIRSKFPETWIFKNLEIKQEKTLLTLDIPETVTTWRITAFTVNQQTGLGVIKEPTDITTFQKFFISLNLPYSVKRGEILTVPVTIFNYFNESLDTQVTMINEEQQYDFVGKQAIGNERNQTKNVILPPNSGKSVTFLINPKEVGDIGLLLIARSSLASDGVNQKLKVEPEGVVMHHNLANYIGLTAGNQQLSSNFTPTVPKNIVPDSEYLTISVGGDMLVPTLENLNSLVRLPTGCGEQNMVNFAPNVLILDYLKATRQFGKQTKLIKTAKHFIEVGYQQELAYRHNNGGFSVFGPNYKYAQEYKIAAETSTWLTAYVIRFFIKASTYIAVEDRIIDDALSYLAGKQLENGEFPNTGYLFDPAHQNRYGLTAYILQTFSEKKKYATKYKNVVDKGLEFLQKNAENIEDLYAMSIVSSTLRMANNSMANELLERIELKANMDNDTKWWSENDQNRNKDVEITAYVAGALLETKADTMPILKWLIKQRNSKGGFKSTHDTVVGLQAMVKFAQKYNNLNSNLKISFKAKNEAGAEVANGEFMLNQGNMLLLQKQELPKSIRHISYEANGIGTMLLQLSYQFNIRDSDKLKNFQIESKIEPINASDKEIQICFEYLQAAPATNLTKSATNMVIMEVNLPSGYRSQASNLLGNEIIERIETKNEDSTVVLYFDKLSANDEHCLSIEAELTHEIDKLKPAAIIMYDYYNASRHDTVFYEFN